MPQQTHSRVVGMTARRNSHNRQQTAAADSSTAAAETAETAADSKELRKRRTKAEGRTRVNKVGITEA